MIDDGVAVLAKPSDMCADIPCINPTRKRCHGVLLEQIDPAEHSRSAFKRWSPAWRRGGDYPASWGELAREVGAGEFLNAVAT